MDLLTNLFGRFPDIRGEVVLWKKGEGTEFVHPQDVGRIPERYDGTKVDYYYHMATHDITRIGSGRGDTKSAQQFTCLWADLDLATKDSIKYPTSNEVRLMLDKLEAMGCKVSCLVNSGHGIHAYWFLDKPYECQEYMNAAKAWITFLSATINEIIGGRKVVVDNIGDMSRVLRVPGTKHFKSNKLVTVIEEEPIYYPLEHLLSFTDYATRRAQKGSGRVSVKKGILASMGMLSTNKLGTIENLLPQCGQLQDYLQQKGQMPEPMWYKMAGLFQYLVDGEDKFITMSEMADPYMDSDRSEAGAIAKMKQWKDESTGPPVCEAMNDTNHGICDACPHFGKITTPIQLSHSQAVVVETAPVAEAVVGELVEVHDNQEAYQFIPPQPFYFNEKDQLMITVNKTDMLVANTRIIPVDRVSNQEGDQHHSTFHILQAGEMMAELTRKPVIIPHNEFTTNVSIGILNSANALIPPSATNHAQLYLTKVIYAMTKQRKCIISHEHLGWLENNDFMLGETRMLGNSQFQAEKISSSVESSMGDISYKGTLKDWRTAIHVLGRPGMEAHLLCFFGAFAVPLFKATDHAGIMVNLVSRDSGTFKSFALKMLTSIYGKPDFNLITSRDTENAMMMKIASRCDLPITFDEITNIEPHALSDLVYALTQGKDKDRMNSATNDLRENAGRWRLVMFTSSNASLDDKLGAVNVAERMRLLEMSVQGLNNKEPINPDEAASVMRTIGDNYGTAGMLWMDYLVSHHDEVFDMCRRMISEVSQNVGRANDKRFWIAYISLSLVAAKLTYDLGLHSFDLKSLKDYAFGILNSSHEKIMGDKTNVFEKVDEFLNEHLDSTLVTQRRETDKGIGEVHREPRKEVYAFIDNMTTGKPGEKHIHVYINRSKMRSFLSEKREDMGELIRQLIETDIILKDESGKPRVNFIKRIPMAKGVATQIGMRSFAIDLNKYHEVMKELKL